MRDITKEDKDCLTGIIWEAAVHQIKEHGASFFLSHTMCPSGVIVICGADVYRQIQEESARIITTDTSAADELLKRISK